MQRNQPHGAVESNKTNEKKEESLGGDENRRFIALSPLFRSPSMFCIERAVRTWCNHRKQPIPPTNQTSMRTWLNGGSTSGEDQTGGISFPVKYFPILCTRVPLHSDHLCGVKNINIDCKHHPSTICASILGLPVSSPERRKERWGRDFFSFFLSSPLSFSSSFHHGFS